MKTRIRTLAAICTLGIIGITNINATADYKKAMNTEITTEAEASLNIENWMTDESIWSSEATINTMETESTLEIEDWMTNENLWTSKTEVVAPETEEALVVEPWMTDENLWN